MIERFEYYLKSNMVKKQKADKEEAKTNVRFQLERLKQNDSKPALK